MPTAQILVNALTTPRAVIAGTLLTLSEAAGGWSSYAWTLLDQPEGAVDALTGAGTATPTITPKKEGTYLVQLVVNAGTNTEQRATAVFYILRLIDDRRDPAAGETLEQNLVRGWAQDVNRQLTDISDLRADPGRIAGVINFNGATAGSTVLYVSGTTTILSGFPGARDLPLFDLAEASDTTKVRGALYLLDRGVTSGSSPSAGDVIWARESGIAFAAPLASTALNQPVYVADTGELGLTPGTFHRCVARVTAARLGDCDIEFEGQKLVLQGGTMLRFGSSRAGTDAGAGYTWPLATGYQPEPPTNGNLLTAGSRLKYIACKPGRWSRLSTYAKFTANPRNVAVAVYKNGAVTSLATTLSSPGGAGVDTADDFNEAHAVEFEVGDELDVQVSNTTAISTETDLDGITAMIFEQLYA